MVKSPTEYAIGVNSINSCVVNFPPYFVLVDSVVRCCTLRIYATARHFRIYRIWKHCLKTNKNYGISYMLKIVLYGPMLMKNVKIEDVRIKKQLTDVNTQTSN